MAGLLSDIYIRVPEKNRKIIHTFYAVPRIILAQYIAITLKFQKLFILFVAAFYPDNSVFCEKMRMSLGTLELIWNKSASVLIPKTRETIFCH